MDDFATAVRDAAHQKLKDGDVDVTVEQGLKAQAILDKREEKDADRRLALSIARMLAGQKPPPTVIIEGVAVIDAGDMPPDEDRDDLAMLGSG